MIRSTIFVFLLVGALPGPAAGVPAPADLPAGFTDEIVADGLRFPVGMAFLPDGRLIVVEAKTARVLVIANGAVGHVGVPDSVQSIGEEQGLLGVEPDPGWPDRPYLYFHHDALDATIWIARYRVGGDLADPASTNLVMDPASRYLVLRDIPDQMGNHNGGTLRFGADGMLYSALAEDANACTAQDTVSLRGVILRMDVSGLPDGPGGPPDKALLVPPGNPLAWHPNPNARLVWAMGLRNPFRFHVDPADGALFIGDVGFQGKEEISRCDAPGMNFGWPFFEGTEVRYACSVGEATGLTGPIYEYDRSGFIFTGLASVISAGVYRSVPGGACNFPAGYEGNVFVADFYEGFLRRVAPAGGGTWSLAPPVSGQPSATDWGRGLFYVSDYLVGPDGALWFCRYMETFWHDSTGQVRRICHAPPPSEVAGDAGGAVASFAPPWPAPARGTVNLRYTLARSGRVTLAIFDATGRVVRRLIAGAEEPAGHRAIAWDGMTAAGRPAPAGMYVARLVVDGVSLERRIPFLR